MFLDSCFLDEMLSDSLITIGGVWGTILSSRRMHPYHNEQHLDTTKCVRRCKQCFAVKPLECYFNRSKTAFCVICDRCRSSQRRRYHCMNLASGGYE